MARSFVLNRIKEIKDELVNRGLNPNTLILSMKNYRRLHQALQTIYGEILIVEVFEDLDVVVDFNCSDDQIHIVDRTYLKKKGGQAK